jgi:hypothetical protein
MPLPKKLEINKNGDFVLNVGQGNDLLLANKLNELIDYLSELELQHAKTQTRNEEAMRYLAEKGFLVTGKEGLKILKTNINKILDGTS